MLDTSPGTACSSQPSLQMKARVDAASPLLLDSDVQTHAAGQCRVVLCQFVAYLEFQSSWHDACAFQLNRRDGGVPDYGRTSKLYVNSVSSS